MCSHHSDRTVSKKRTSNHSTVTNIGPPSHSSTIFQSVDSTQDFPCELLLHHQLHTFRHALLLGLASVSRTSRVHVQRSQSPKFRPQRDITNFSRSRGHEPRSLLTCLFSFHVLHDPFDYGSPKNTCPSDETSRRRGVEWDTQM